MNPLSCTAIELIPGAVVYPIRIYDGESGHDLHRKSIDQAANKQKPPTSSPVRLPAIIGFALMMISLAWYSQAWGATAKVPEDLKDLIIESPIPLKRFELMNHQHQPFNVKNLENKWTFIFFGYTHCPDICPATLAELNTAAAQLTSQQNSTKTPTAATETPNREIQYVFVSVDSARDTIDELSEYISYFNKDFVAVTGLKEQLTELTTQLGVKFEIGDGTATQYFVSHASAVLLIDPQARYYARFRAPHYSEELISGFNKIRDFHQLTQ